MVSLFADIAHGGIMDWVFWITDLI